MAITSLFHSPQDLSWSRSTCLCPRIMSLTTASMNCSKMSYQDTLHNILSFAQSIKASSKLAKPPPPRTAHRSPASLPTLSLPIPDGISSSLLGPIACSPTAALSLSQAFARSARRLRAAHESAYQELAIQVSSDPLHRVKQLNSLKSFLENQYREQLRVAEQLAIDQAQQQLNSQQSKQRPAFNQVSGHHQS